VCKKDGEGVWKETRDIKQDGCVKRLWREWLKHSGADCSQYYSRFIASSTKYQAEYDYEYEIIVPKLSTRGSFTTWYQCTRVRFWPLSPHTFPAATQQSGIQNAKKVARKVQ
jgi:hypothetical protein